MTIQEQLTRDEELRLYVYPDSLGYWTIGVGRCVDKRKGEGLTKDEAVYLLTNDIVRVKAEVIQHFPWSAQLDDARIGVLLNMTFNMGVDGVGKFHQMLAHMQAGEWPAASQEMLNSLWAKQVGDRAKRLAQQMVTGEWQ